MQSMTGNGQTQQPTYGLSLALTHTFEGNGTAQEVARYAECDGQ